MPEKETVERARRDKRQGKAPTTQAGEFVREEMHHVREGKHGARSPERVRASGTPSGHEVADVLSDASTEQRCAMGEGTIETKVQSEKQDLVFDHKRLAFRSTLPHLT